MKRTLLLEDNENLNRGISLKLSKERYQISLIIESGNKEHPNTCGNWWLPVF